MEDIMSKIAGGCISLCIIGGLIMKCSKSDEPERIVSPTPNPIQIAPKPEPKPNPEPEWVEEWYDDPFCNGSGKCSVCDGEGGYRIDKIYYMCNGCNGTGRCSNCGGQGQAKSFRQVYR